MIGLTEMQNEEFEARILPYVNKIVDAETKFVKYEFKRKPKCCKIQLREDPDADKIVHSGAIPRRVLTPEGVFANCAEAADHFGLTKEQIYQKINNARKKRVKEWVLLEHEYVNE